MATMTLGEFEREYGINRGTVQKRAQAMGYSTSDGLSEKATDELMSYYKVGPYAPSQREQQPDATRSELVLVEGSIQGVETPQMEQYKFKMPEVLAKTFDDPLALATQFLEFGDQLIQQLDAKATALEKRADDTRLANQMIADKTRRLAAKQRTVEIKEAVATAFIERDMADIKRQTGV